MMAEAATLLHTSADLGAIIGSQTLQQQQLMASQLTEFSYQLELRHRLQACLSTLLQRIPVHNMACVQVWRPVSHQRTVVDPLMMQIYADPELVILGDASFASFRLNSCQCLQWGKEGMPGRVLKSGCVQVVQNLQIIPGVLHPRSRVGDAVAGLVGEVVYVPVYCTSRPHVGPVAVLEAVLSAQATDSMLVANFISIAGSALSAMKLSLSNPLPQPVRRSKLEGRKPRPVQPPSTQNLTQACPAAPVAPISDAVQPQVVPASQQEPVQCSAPPTAQTASGIVSKQQRCTSCPAPASPAVSDISCDVQSGGCSSCSTASTTIAAGYGGKVVVQSVDGAAGTTAATGILNSTLSSRLRTAPLISPAQSPLGNKRHEHPTSQEAGAADAGPASKMQRTLSICRTKSVPAGLNHVLEVCAAEGC